MLLRIRYIKMSCPWLKCDVLTSEEAGSVLREAIFVLCVGRADDIDAGHACMAYLSLDSLQCSRIRYTRRSKALISGDGEAPTDVGNASALGKPSA